MFWEFVEFDIITHYFFSAFVHHITHIRYVSFLEEITQYVPQGGFTILRTNMGQEKKYYAQLITDFAAIRNEAVPFEKHVVFLMYNSDTNENMRMIRKRQRAEEPDFTEKFLRQLNALISCFVPSEALGREVNSVTIDVAGLSREDVWNKIKPNLTTHLDEHPDW